MTKAPHTNSQKSVSVGKASHVHGAAPGGPRYDTSQSSEERRSIENGIWLCSNCATLIDTDVARWPAHRLRKWKARAEDEATHGIGVPARSGAANDLINLVAPPKPPRERRTDRQARKPKAAGERAIRFPLPVHQESPALLFPLNLSHLGTSGDAVAMGLVVSGNVIHKFGNRIISGQQLFDLVGALSFELAEAMQGQVLSNRWVMDGSAAKISDDVARILGLIVRKLVELKLLKKPITFKYIIGVHSRGSTRWGGARLAVESWGGIYDTKTKAITSYVEIDENVANKPRAVMGALSSTYNEIVSKLIKGSAEARQREFGTPRRRL